MNEIANTPLDKRNMGHDENQEVEWQTDIETTSVKTRYRRNTIYIIWAAFWLKGEGKLDKLQRTWKEGMTL